MEVVTDCYVSRISEISEEGTGFKAFTSRGEFTADKLILACGSEAGVTDERAFNAYGFLTSFGHYVYPALPALVPLFSDSGLESIWDGVRVIAAVTYRENREEGEIKLTKKGISGIPVFQLSRYIAEDLRLRPAFVTIDFIPNYEEEALIGYLTELKGTKRAEQDGYEVLTGCRKTGRHGERLPASHYRNRRPSGRPDHYGRSGYDRVFRTAGIPSRARALRDR